MNSSCLFCPANIPFVYKPIKFYRSTIPPKISYCEYCFKHFSNLVTQTTFYLETHPKNQIIPRCHTNKQFKSCSLICDNIKIFIINYDNYYRYNYDAINNGFIIPENTKFMILIENTNYEKISIDSLFHGATKNIIYNELSYSILITSLSYKSDLVSDKSNDNTISLIINKWKSHPDDSQCCILDAKIKIKFSLIHQAVYIPYYNPSIPSDKIIIIKNCLW